QAVAPEVVRCDDGGTRRVGRRNEARMNTIDHIIVKVNDVERSIAFYRDVLGFAFEGHDGPFATMRVGPDFVLQLAPYGTQGMEHYAFALSRADFDAVMQKLETAGIPYGPSFDSVGKERRIGRETGAR